MLKETVMSEGHSFPSPVLELGKPKRVELMDSSFITNVVIKRQRMILEKPGIAT